MLKEVQPSSPMALLLPFWKKPPIFMMSSTGSLPSFSVVASKSPTSIGNVHQYRSYDLCYQLGRSVMKCPSPERFKILRFIYSPPTPLHSKLKSFRFCCNSRPMKALSWISIENRRRSEPYPVVAGMATLMYRAANVSGSSMDHRIRTCGSRQLLKQRDNEFERNRRLCAKTNGKLLHTANFMTVI